MRLRATRLISVGRGRPAWTPAQIPTSLWLDATDTSTITLNGSTVSQWNDKSGNGRNATQATAANQPSYSATGLLGKPTLSWPNTANPRSIRVASNVRVQDFYCVTQYADGVQATWISANAGLFGGDGGSSYIGLIGNGTTDPYWYQFCNFQSIRKNGGAVQTAGTGTAVALPLPGAIINGTDTVTRNTPMDIGMDRDLNAFNRGWNGMIGEVIALPTTATTATRQLIEGYLAWKWGGF